MPVINDRTPLLDLPLPNVDNTLEDDVGRLRDGLGAIDTLLFGKQAALGFTPENSAAKGVPDGYAALDGTGKVPAIQLPGFVDDVVEVANFASLPTTGETGKIYVALDNNKTWRWGGSAYAEISASPGSTDAVPEGASNLYHTPARVAAAIPIASAGVLGGVKIGAGLSIDGSGVLVATSGGGSSMSLVEITPASDGLSTVPVPGGYVVGATLFGLGGGLLPPSEYTATDGLNVTFLNTTVGTLDTVLVVTLSTVTIGNLPDGSVTPAKLSFSIQSGRNLLINGNFNVNQRAYVSGTATGGANQYTLDRWRVVTSGQNLTFAASGNGNIVTAPAGGIEQVIEGANIGGTTHVINWTGTATCTVDGVAKAKGDTVALTPGTNCTVKFIGGTVGQAQLERGAKATPFEFRPVSVDLALCQRYYETVELGFLLTTGSVTAVAGTGNFIVPKRAVPTLVRLGAGLGGFGLPDVITATATGYYFQRASTNCGGLYSASAEL